MSSSLLEPQTPSVDHQADLLTCCRYLVTAIGHEEAVDGFEKAVAELGEAERKKTLEVIIGAARREGLQASIHRPNTNIDEISLLLPAAVESREGYYKILSSAEQAGEGDDFTVTLLMPKNGTFPFRETVSGKQFLADWSGGLLRFEKINTALTCFAIIAREHKIEITRDRLIHEYELGSDEIPGTKLLRIAKEHGLKAKALSLSIKELLNMKKAYPAMAELTNGRHLLVLGPVAAEDEETAVACYDPLAGDNGSHLRMSEGEFEKIWSGKVYVFKRIYKLNDENQPFSLRWFLPEIFRQRTAFIDIGLAVLFINIISLITPIFFQIIIDKVLVNHALTTLHVIGIGMTAMLLVNACLDFLRDYLLLHATNKIDLRVTARTFRHMLNLPLEFFERVTAGVLTKHMQQTTSIRSFLTGNVFLTILEATSLFVFVPFLFFYSFKLTSIVLLFTAMISLVMFVLMAPFKRRLNALYEAEGGRQAMLVETINGMQTVKAMAIEPLLRNKWENKVAQAVSMQFLVGKISISAKSLTRFLERLMTIVLIWVGASQVFDGSLTVGALIAFQMLAGRVTSPLVRLVGLVHQYQEAALSVEKLGVVMNAKPEWGADRHGARPSLRGDIVLDRVSFRYGPDLPDALKELSLVIPAGSSLGIVGPSGSGKTTLTRMLQKAYFPSRGTIRINNCYLNELDTAHLRRNTGVVLQESFLFRATVAENIRAGQAGASRQQIIEAAVLAGADEFIVKLPQGYDTLLEEGAGNLSGGQRQRLAIARALLTRPEILILDEATSSLDPESERIVRENLRKITSGRTVIMVSHRLSMLRDADNIIVLQDGQLVGIGPHDVLLEKCGLYQTLWQQQMSTD